MPQQKWRHQPSQNPKTRQGLRQEVQLREEENDPKNFLRTTTFDFYSCQCQSFARFQLLLQVLLLSLRSSTTLQYIEKPCQLLLLRNFVVRFWFFFIIIYTSPPVLNRVTPENVNEIPQTKM